MIESKNMNDRLRVKADKIKTRGSRQFSAKTRIGTTALFRLRLDNRCIPEDIMPVKSFPSEKSL